MWVLLVVFIPLVGVIVWFTLGRDYSTSTWRPARRSRPSSPSSSAYASPSTPRRDERSTEEQLAALEREIERAEQDRKLKRLEAEFEDPRRDGDA
ncbi:PLD nuclease N-terminal domain-containing protein [Plantibacter sp. Mn2098]|uniref:PLD nuclease N-terminal domain-containing protein n=1 Tax=Plantibacter sp. Mn2098 TaxID=3395266 RepID=UPI003BC3312A